MKSIATDFAFISFCREDTVGFVWLKGRPVAEAFSCLVCIAHNTYGGQVFNPLANKVTAHKNNQNGSLGMWKGPTNFVIYCVAC